MKLIIKAGILLENLYEDLELWYPYYRLKEADIDVSLISPERGKTYYSKHQYPATADMDCQEALQETFHILIIPGGYAPDHMRRTPDMVELVAQANAAGAYIATICHGGWMLCSVPGCITDKTVTGFYSIRHDLENAGAHYVDKEVVVDENIITSRTPKDLPFFMSAIIKALDT